MEIYTHLHIHVKWIKTLYTSTCSIDESKFDSPLSAQVLSQTNKNTDYDVILTSLLFFLEIVHY
jgi:hypothetical protein